MGVTGVTLALQANASGEEQGNRSSSEPPKHDTKNGKNQNSNHHCTLQDEFLNKKPPAARFARFRGLIKEEYLNYQVRNFRNTKYNESMH